MRHGVESAVWFVLLTGIYLVLISSVTDLEIAVGALVAATGTALAVLGRSAERLRDVPRFGWLAWAAWLPAAVLADTARLAWGLGRRIAGRGATGGFVEVRLGPVDDRHRAAQRALAMLAISLAPGSYALGVDRSRHAVRVHRVPASSPPAARLDRQVGR